MNEPATMRKEPKEMGPVQSRISDLHHEIIMGSNMLARLEEGLRPVLKPEEAKSQTAPGIPRASASCELESRIVDELGQVVQTNAVLSSILDRLML